ncbi:hypothetical protein RYX36_013001, partial [Vicia faba]
FSLQFASKFCSTHRLRFKITQKLDYVLNFFKNHNFSDSQLCNMIAKNSIRSIAPKFDSNLVWNILHASINLDQALKFYRWLECSNLSTHDADTTLKMPQILTRLSKLNPARCLLLDLPKKNLPYDEDMFIALI